MSRKEIKSRLKFDFLKIFTVLLQVVFNVSTFWECTLNAES